MKKVTTPTIEEFRKYVQDYRSVPVSRTILSDSRTPIEVLRSLKAVSRHCFILESLEDSVRWGRYTFLGYDPSLEFTCRDGVVTIRSAATMRFHDTDPAQYIRQIIAEHKAPRIPGLPPFTGGLMGYFAYDFIKYSEPSLNPDSGPFGCGRSGNTADNKVKTENKVIKEYKENKENEEKEENREQDEEQFNDVDLMLFEKIIAFDNLRQTITMIVNVRTDAPEENYRSACLELDIMEEIVRHGTPAVNPPLKLKSDFRPMFSREQFCAMVERGKHYIFEGDIFQVVLSNRLMAEMEGSLLDTYRLLRTRNPSPYMFYISSDSLELAGSSPETLVKLQDGILHTFPLAGTRPRGRTHEEDLALEKSLLSDPKELSEHNMLVDLGRNDLGRLSIFGTVKVEKYMGIERYSHVMHIGSTVRGEIRGDKDALDAISSVLPAGTLSGAPKIRACEIIHELERGRRGIYGGAIGYIDFTGNMDTCISIRLAFKKNGRVYVRSGAGIVADSVPENEYTECINKAAAVINAVRESEGGIDR